MRNHPIGTGPFKFVEFKPNQSITVTRNPDYWKPGRPYLDGIEWAIVKDTSTRLLSFIAGQARKTSTSFSGGPTTCSIPMPYESRRKVLIVGSTVSYFSQMVLGGHGGGC
jgi:peptide/nickel transport system substrate-binding protein